MNEKAKGMKIKVLEDGPYLVTGNVPLSEKIISSKGGNYEWKEGEELPQSATYTLCRCGKTKTPPFCDGMHTKAGFFGEENASRKSYAERAMLCKGPEIDMMDDRRCAFARFCHRHGSDAWELIVRSNDPQEREEAIKAAAACPSGRLVAVTKDGEILEPELEPGIEIIQDPERGVSGGIYVKGGIPIEATDGTQYEIQNRVVLCRCGSSRIKPFCDATHVSTGYRDNK